MKEKKRIKKEMRCGKSEINKEKLERLKEQILNEESENYYRRLQKTCDEISKNGRFSSGKFWEVKKKMERKKEDGAHAVRNKEGKLVNEREEILDAYKEYFEDLLTITSKKTRLAENQETVAKVEKKFGEILEKGRTQEHSSEGAKKEKSTRHMWVE